MNRKGAKIAKIKRRIRQIVKLRNALRLRVPTAKALRAAMRYRVVMADTLKQIRLSLHRPNQKTIEIRSLQTRTSLVLPVADVDLLISALGNLPPAPNRRGGKVVDAVWGRAERRAMRIPSRNT